MSMFKIIKGRGKIKGTGNIKILQKKNIQTQYN